MRGYRAEELTDQWPKTDAEAEKMFIDRYPEKVAGSLYSIYRLARVELGPAGAWLYALTHRENVERAALEEVNANLPKLQNGAD